MEYAFKNEIFEKPVLPNLPMNIASIPKLEKTKLYF